MSISIIMLMQKACELSLLKILQKLYSPYKR